jgi:hypothetical protein
LAALVLANALPIAACVPGDISYDGTETSGSETASTLETDTDSDATSTLGDGDGDPGDGDGDTCESTAAIECDDLNRCWAQDADWPAWAQWADPVDVQNGVDAGTLTPVDIGLSAECYVLSGADHHVCVIDVDCTPLLGRPATEVGLTESDCAPIGGPWSWVGEMENDPTGACWGIIGEIAVQLRPDSGSLPFCDSAEHIEFAEVLCTQDGCEGRWQGTDAWSPATPATELLGLTPVDPSTLWPCDPAPEVDGCFMIDGSGHAACVWIMNGWAVPVAPCCAVDGFSWLPVGDGMAVSPD